MSQPLETIGQLSKMKRELSASTLDELRGATGNYAARLALMADKSFMYGNLISGTTVSSFGVVRNAFGRHGVRHVARGVFMRHLPTPAGDMLTYPFKTTGITDRTRHPIIDPTAEGCYSIVHVPSQDNAGGRMYDLANVKVDLVFSVDEHDVVTTDSGIATSHEHMLFDGIVQEFERRVAGIGPADMAAARIAAQYR